ncbi:fumarylacetoacetate hydrolase family protein [Cupriavidus sp. D39]|uniref:fumarylacetoacetate hydrolase family protein n=1 Tax=Cupriavidus sp. D39 TaxID=2997877 RepID=UPI00226E1EBC|nr:fumarylacetoacetate hydrolase family protein [Cupriavidus sp. D39]MCY0854367.1 fumarylacetoacetate hydrolase family protein [Cupriavidus sp. D39]
MKLASLNNGTPDGQLVVVSRDMRTASAVPTIAATMQAALDRWTQVLPGLQRVYERLNASDCPDAWHFDPTAVAAPLPRAYQFLDGSVYPSHMATVRKARGAIMPAGFETTPLLYQGNSDRFLAPTEPILHAQDEGYGIDFEAEVVAVTGNVPQGTRSASARSAILLLGLLNDTSLRGVIPDEIGRGFGFMQGKPARTMGPVFITPDEAGPLWDGRLLSGRYVCEVRGERIGELDPGIDAMFGYDDLIAHAARTRDLGAGTVLGLGAIANLDRRRGCGCIAELRAYEQIEQGQARTPCLRFGDDVYLELFAPEGTSLFGAIRQRVGRFVSVSG